MIKQIKKCKSRKCKEKVYVKSLRKYKPCIGRNCRGSHTADLTGERFGCLVVLRLGESKYSYKGRHTTWIVNKAGTEVTVRAATLLSGKNSGLMHGISHVKGKARPEYVTVMAHYNKIFKSKKHKDRYYKGMPFFDGWNPKKEGALWKGVLWILENLGPKPSSKWSLDIVEHEKGFVPGNLRWARHHTQRLNQQYRTLGKFGISELRVEAKRHGYKLVRI